MAQAGFDANSQEQWLKKQFATLKADILRFGLICTGILATLLLGLASMIAVLALNV